jgi:hypothetical protein
MDNLAEKLSKAPLHKFSDWPCPDLPRIASGVYTIFDTKESFLYVGMAGAKLDPTQTRLKKESGKQSGLFARLASHATGYRSGDRFNIYVGDLYVLQCLTTDHIESITNRTLTFDYFIKEYIRNNLAYRFLITSHIKAPRLEKHIQENGIHGIKPTINPKPLKKSHQPGELNRTHAPPFKTGNIKEV